MLYRDIFLLTPSGTRLSLDAIKRRLQIFNKYSKDADKMDSKPPLFRADIVLAIPNVVLKPSLDDLQSALNKAVQLILKTSQDIPQWEHLIYHQKQQQKVRVMCVAVWIYLCVCMCAHFFFSCPWLNGLKMGWKNFIHWLQFSSLKFRSKIFKILFKN